MLNHEAVRRNEAPPLALWIIALTALAPFPIAAGFYGWADENVARPALTVILTWSAVVLSFLGGVRWGLETALKSPRAHRMIISVGSPIGAWLLLLARGRVDDAWVVGGYIAAFLLQWLFDHQPNAPARYPRLSTSVTAAACVSLAVCLERALNS
jgi:hypothetical protein